VIYWFLLKYIIKGLTITQKLNFVFKVPTVNLFFNAVMVKHMGEINNLNCSAKNVLLHQIR
jgi:hypothetical protein